MFNNILLVCQVIFNYFKPGLDALIRDVAPYYWILIEVVVDIQNYYYYYL